VVAARRVVARMKTFELDDNEARMLHACLFDSLTSRNFGRRLDTPEAWHLEQRLRTSFNHLPQIVNRYREYHERLEWHIQAMEAERSKKIEETNVENKFRALRRQDDMRRWR
jgi:SMC interacting uncharacterized protein involved in chromosome segregation